MGPTNFSTGSLCYRTQVRKGLLSTGTTATVAGYNAQEGLKHRMERNGPKDGAFFYLAPMGKLYMKTTPYHKFCGDMKDQ